jgi:hypothetical protein
LLYQIQILGIISKNGGKSAECGKLLRRQGGYLEKAVRETCTSSSGSLQTAKSIFNTERVSEQFFPCWVEPKAIQGFPREMNLGVGNLERGDFSYALHPGERVRGGGMLGRVRRNE